MPIEPINCGSSGTQNPLTCATDSVSICNGEEPIMVLVCQDDPLAVCFTLSCETDSITICPAAESVTALSSRIPLGANATFTSPWINVEKQASIRCGVLTDQDGVLFTEHSNDNGVSIIRSSEQVISANKGEFLSFHPRGDWFRVRYVNGPTPQGALDLSTDIDVVAYAVTQSPFGSPLSRNSFGVQSRSVLYDYNYDETAIITPFIRDLVTVQRVSLMADPFNNSMLDNILWNTTVTGTGAAALVSNRLQLLTGVTANSTAKVNSAIRGRFISGNLQSVRSGIRTPDAGTVNNKRRWGAYDVNDGFFYELDGTILYAVGRLNGVDTRVASSNWSRINTFQYTANTTNSFEISYFADVAYFVVNGEVSHVMFGGGLRGSYPNTFENINYGGSIVNTELDVLGSFQQRYGPVFEQPRFYNITGAQTINLKHGPGHLDKIIVGSGGTGSVNVFDNVVGSGLVITKISNVSALLSLAIGLDFSVGLTIVTAGAATDITAVFT